MKISKRQLRKLIAEAMHLPQDGSDRIAANQMKLDAEGNFIRFENDPILQSLYVEYFNASTDGDFESPRFNAALKLVDAIYAKFPPPRDEDNKVIGLPDGLSAKEQEALIDLLEDIDDMVDSFSSEY